MKITRNQLKSLIKEEMKRTFRAPVAAMEESEHAHQTLVSKEPAGGEHQEGQPTWVDVENAWRDGWYNGGDAGSDIDEAWLDSNAKFDMDESLRKAALLNAKEDTTPAS
jgi:hypothetical protein